MGLISSASGVLASQPVASTFDFVRAHWAVLLSVALILRFAVKRYWTPLRHVPGPFYASISRGWKVSQALRRRMHYACIEMHKKYGPVVRIAPDEVSFSSAAAAKEIYSTGKGFHKTDYYALFPPPENPDIFTETDEEKHGVKRRMASNAYSMKSVLDFERFVDKTEKCFFRRLDELFVRGEERAGEECDLGSWLQYFAFDVIGEILLSRSFGFLEAGSDVMGGIDFIEKTFDYYAVLGHIPEYHIFFWGNPLWNFVKPKISLVTGIVLGEMRARKTSSDKQFDRKDLMSRFFESKEAHPEKMNEMDVFSISHGAIFAGSDSTAISLRSILYQLMKNPDKYSKMMEEIEEYDRKGLLSTPVAYSQAIKMPYLQAVIKEGMRLHPAVGIPMPRYVPPGGAVIDGRYYPEKTRVGVNAWVIHRNQEIFGADADAFRPERWFEDNNKSMERNLYYFGAGSHVCIGKNISLMEINKLLPGFLRRYRVRLVNPDEELKHRCNFFVPQSGLKVYVERRSNN
ncbi:cytochrome P450 oxidoreductase [Glonium stellatum]|uniref:Cytochrome P450 oxidoreductase n=1 Tax=Glonium stellatum TaxID=574774 RepID=A0A8E2JSP8_9PEZI|nr:cytochrome P450 oxidoreductase [Glonium stellatum]